MRKVVTALTLVVGLALASNCFAGWAFTTNFQKQTQHGWATHGPTAMASGIEQNAHGWGVGMSNSGGSTFEAQQQTQLATPGFGQVGMAHQYKSTTFTSGQSFTGYGAQGVTGHREKAATTGGIATANTGLQGAVLTADKGVSKVETASLGLAGAEARAATDYNSAYLSSVASGDDSITQLGMANSQTSVRDASALAGAGKTRAAEKQAGGSSVIQDGAGKSQASGSFGSARTHVNASGLGNNTGNAFAQNAQEHGYVAVNNGPAAQQIQSGVSRTYTKAEVTK